MKWIKYRFGTGSSLLEKAVGFSEANLAIAQAEAYRGEYTIEDDGEESVPVYTAEERIRSIEQFIGKLKALFPNLED